MNDEVTNSAGEPVPIGTTEGGAEIAPEVATMKSGYHYPRRHSGFSFNELVKVVDEFNKADCECCSPSDLDTAFDEAGFVYDEDGNFDGNAEADAVRAKLHAFAVVLAYATSPAPTEHAWKERSRNLSNSMARVIRVLREGDLTSDERHGIADGMQDVLKRELPDQHDEDEASEIAEGFYGDVNKPMTNGDEQE